IGKAKNWALYRSRFVEPIRINAGVQFWQANAETLARAEAEYGVPAEIIVAIIGVETIFGRNTGNFRVMDVVTTLAFSYPDTPKRAERSAFFRGELENALILAHENGIDPFSMRGSYAGAIGLPQFMPSSIRNFGVDYDGDGKIDLRNSAIDAIGSVAHFLQQHGWRKNEPLAFAATVTQSDNPPWAIFLEQGLEAKYSLQEIRQAGIGVAADVPENLQYGLVDLQNGNSPTEYWLGTNNFFAITRYNRSYFYAMSVIELGQAIKNAKKR
ncbi:MAG: lytic murein transglycosylase B, partial [Burkholderiales bacterium]|nr:lytic murein transglycosylase B [Burkholderiales bacterium]